MQSEVQPEQCPAGVLEAVQLVDKCRRPLRAPDQVLEGLMHIYGRGDEAAGAHRAPIGQRDAAGTAALDENALDRHLRDEGAAGRDERFHQSARQIERAALQADSRSQGRRRGLPSP